MFAIRFFFCVYYYGYPAKDILIFDGGLSKWQEAGLRVTNELTGAPKRGTFTIKNVNEDIKSDLPEFLTASGDTIKNILLEALDADWHFIFLPFFNKPGHIPNAIMLPSADFFNPDKTFKSPAEIRNILNYLGISPEQKIDTNFGGGEKGPRGFFFFFFFFFFFHIKKIFFFFFFFYFF